MSQENQDKQIVDVSAEEKIISSGKETSQLDLVPTRRPIYIRTLNVFRQPFRNRYERHYRDKKYHLVIDILFIIIIVLLAVLNIILLTKHYYVNNISVPTHQEKIVGPFVSLSYQNSNGNLPLTPGEKNSFTLNIKNISSYTLDELSVQIDLSGQAIDFDSIKTNGTLEDDHLIWSSKNIEALKAISPDDSLSLDFSFEVKQNISVVNPVVSTSARVQGTANGEDFIDSTDIFYYKVNSDLVLITSSKYFTTEGEQVGFGAWPPRVGEPTSLRIFLNPINHVNNLSDVAITSTLTDNVNWVGNAVVNAGVDITYDGNTRRISWQIGDLSTQDEVVGSFEVEFIPLDNTLDKNIQLLYNSQITATDTFTGARLQSAASDLYSEEKVN